MAAKKQNKPPVITFNRAEPMQDYFSDGFGRIYSVARLVDEAKDLEPFDCPLAALDLSCRIFDECDIYDVAWHIKKVNDADLSYPIILSWDGGVADGRHRILKALLEGRRTIKAVRIMYEMAPDRVED